MKIKRIYCNAAITSKGYMLAFSSDKFKIQFVPEMRGYLVDGDTLIPESNVKEVMLEIVPQPKVEAPVVETAPADKKKK